jgi:hypothetical protein
MAAGSEGGNRDENEVSQEMLVGIGVASGIGVGVGAAVAVAVGVRGAAVVGV